MASKQAVSEVLDELGLAYNRAVPVALKQLYWAGLQDLSDEQLRDAAVAHRDDEARCGLWPQTGDLKRAARQAVPQHPGTDAAWPIAVMAMDESRSVVLTDQIQEASRLAAVMWRAGDKIGARLAFRAVYEQILGQTPAPPAWRLSPGFDATQRREAVQDAVARGLLTQRQAVHLLPAPEHKGIPEAVADLLGGKVLAFPVPEAESRGGGLRRVGMVMREALSGEAKPREDTSREATERRRAELVAQADRLMEEWGGRRA